MGSAQVERKAKDKVYCVGVGAGSSKGLSVRDDNLMYVQEGRGHSTEHHGTVYIYNKSNS